MDKIFSKGIYKDGLKRLKLPVIIMTVMIVIESVLIPVLNYIGSARFEPEMTEYEFINAQLGLAAMIAVIPFMTCALFDFMEKRNASDFYHSLPVSRSAVFVSNLLAVLTWTVVLTAASILLNVITIGILPKMTLTYEQAGDYISLIMVAGLYFAAVRLLAKNLTGDKLSSFAITLFIIFVPRGLIMFLQCVMEAHFSYVAIDQESIFWNFKYNIVWSVFDALDMEDMSGTKIYSTIISLIYIAVAGVLFVNRKSEKAENVAITPALQRTFSLIPAMLFSLIPDWMVITRLLKAAGIHTDYGSYADTNDMGTVGFIIYVAVFYMIAVAIYLLYELITTRKFGAVAKAIKKAWLLAVINIVIIICVMVNSYVVRSEVPDAEDIDYVRITDFDGINSLQSATTKIKLENDELNSIVAANLKDRVENGSSFLNEIMETGSVYIDGDSPSTMTFAIHYNGKTIYRNLIVDEDDVLALALENEDYAAAFCMLPEESEINQADYEIKIGDVEVAYSEHLYYEPYPELYEALIADLEDMDNATRIEEYNKGWNGEGLYLYVKVRWDDYEESTYHAFSVNEENFPRTYKLAREIFYEEYNSVENYE